MCNSRVRPRIIWFKELDSTNLEAKRNISLYDDMSVIAAVSQTAGRGQGDHTWHSVPGENLTLTIVLKHRDFPASLQMGISAATVATMLRLLENNGIRARFKWPNDIYVGDKKICGILIDHSLKSEWLNWSIIGIGLNVNQTVFPPDLPNPVSMKSIDGQTRDCGRVLDSLAAIFADSISRLRGSLPQFRDIVGRAFASEDGAARDENLRAGFSECVDVLLGDPSVHLDGDVQASRIQLGTERTDAAVSLTDE